jgi:hypothetical protein
MLRTDVSHIKLLTNVTGLPRFHDLDSDNESNTQPYFFH